MKQQHYPMLEVWISRVVVALMHIGCFLIIWSGISWIAAIVCLLAYLARGFAITGGYHRYFSHRSYRTSRVFQAILAILGITAVQGGPLKWSKEHRHHHKESDQPADLHSPRPERKTWWSRFVYFWWSHLGWILSSRMPEMKTHVRDLEKYPELIWIERFQLAILGAYIGGLYLLGWALGDAWGTSGFQMVVWGFFVSTVITWHITWCVNSVTHTFGTRRYETTDDSRNNWIVGIFALGEGHHNNHHAHQHICRQGLLWWEFDLTYYILKGLSCIGVVWDLNEPEPETITVAYSLSKIRRSLERRRLQESAIADHMLDWQGKLAAAVRTMVNARKALEDKFREKLQGLKEMAVHLRETARRRWQQELETALSAAARQFHANLRQAETAALAA